MGSNNRINGNDRGVALIIVLLVTALLIALIFEFAYGTRVSLRAAANFRDSQRAYYLARSGVNAVGIYLSGNLKNGDPQRDLEMREPWPAAYLLSGNDKTFDIRWYDEGGKINISNVSNGTTAYIRLSKLFEIIGINQDVLENMAENKKKYYLTTELHQLLNNDDFRKLKDMVTVSSVGKININTAPSEVLQSLGLSSDLAGAIIEKRTEALFVIPSDINDFPGMITNTAGMLDVTSNEFKVYSYATVGGYTKEVVASITRSASGFKVNSWSAL